MPRVSTARIRRHLKSLRYPIYETRNRLLGARGARLNRRFQLDEIHRLGALPGAGQLRARVVVVIPTFNRPEALAAAVHSALTQSFDDLAVVVVDDGGGLPELPQDPRLVPVSLRRNSGTVGLVRNVGISLADSEFIAYLDDDNLWTPDHVATAVAALDADSMLAAVYTSVRRLWPDGSQLDVLDEPFNRRKLRSGSFVDMNSLVVRRAANVGFSALPRNKNTHPEEDWEYLWRLSRRGRVAHVSKVTVLYAINPASYYTTWLDGEGRELGSAPPTSPEDS